MCVCIACVYMCMSMCVWGRSSIFLTSRKFPDVCAWRACICVCVCVCVCVWEGGGGGSSIFLTSRKFPDNVCVHSVCVYVYVYVCVCVGGGV